MADKATTPDTKAKFLEGNLMRHIVVMASSSAVGLVSIFLVDLIDLYFISLLGRKELAAAVGFAGTLLFIAIAINIGFMIATSALAARRIGEGDPDGAKRIATNTAVLGIAIGLFVSIMYFAFAPQFAGFIGAEGETRDLAARYMRIIAPTMSLSVISMIATGLLRAHGDARRAMVATLSAGIVNAVLDPILIFGVGLGLDGAAIASACARIAMFITAVYPIFKHYGGVARFELSAFRKDLRPILGIASPAILTNIATPIGGVIVTRSIAMFGDGAVAGYAVVGRVLPLFFCVLFSLSGAIGPIMGQNFGAQQYRRVKETFTKSLQFAAIYTAIASILLVWLNGWISAAFNLDETGAAIVYWFALLGAPLFFFNGALFAGNASFNNLNRPFWSTMLNWGRNTIGIAPFVWYGAKWGGAPGVVVGQAVGGIAFAVIAVWLVYRLVDDYEAGRADPAKGSTVPLMRPRSTPPFSNPRG